MSARSQIYHIPPAKGFNTKELSQLSVRQDLPMEARNLAIELAKFKHGTATMAAAIAELVRSACAHFSCLRLINSWPLFATHARAVFGS